MTETQHDHTHDHTHDHGHDHGDLPAVPEAGGPRPAAPSAPRRSTT